MNNPEEAIEKVLAGLRETDVPAGMERRILQRLEERAAEPGSVWRRLRPMWMVATVRPAVMISVACGFVVATLFTVVLVVPAIRRAGHAPVDTNRKFAAQEDAPMAGLAGGPSSGTAVKDSVSPSRAREAREQWGIRTKAHGAVAPRGAGADASADSIAVSEMRAASFPAPPMPLTEQEKLLLRIAHRGDPVEVAMLDQKQRSVQDLKEKVEYQSFFARPAIEQGMADEAGSPADGVEAIQQDGKRQNPEGDGGQKSKDSVSENQRVQNEDQRVR